MPYQEISTTPALVEDESIPLVRCLIFPICSQPSQNQLSLLKKYSSSIDKATAHAISFKFHNNSKPAYSDTIGVDRPASAYFTLLGDYLIIEWGMVSNNGQAKLHDYLRENINYGERLSQESVLRSGHMGKIDLENMEQQEVALIDSLMHGIEIGPENPEYPLVTTLLTNNILPVTTDGFSVEFVE